MRFFILMAAICAYMPAALATFTPSDVPNRHCEGIEGSHATEVTYYVFFADHVYSRRTSYDVESKVYLVDDREGTTPRGALILSMDSVDSARRFIGDIFGVRFNRNVLELYDGGCFPVLTTSHYLFTE